jgi:predicted GIY-YIG superfamily endonuclease
VLTGKPKGEILWQSRGNFAILFLFWLEGGIMKKAIYKIENLINGKKYIGQSVNPNYRFSQHKFGDSAISKAIKKYGESNFSFEILEWTEDYNERERFYIQ